MMPAQIAVTFYQRGGDAVGMVDDLLQAIVAFDAGLAPVYCSLPARGDGDDFIFKDL